MWRWPAAATDGGGDGWRRRRTASRRRQVGGGGVATDLARDLLHGILRGIFSTGSCRGSCRNLARSLGRRRQTLNGKSASAGRPPRGPKPTLKAHMSSRVGQILRHNAPSRSMLGQAGKEGGGVGSMGYGIDRRLRAKSGGPVRACAAACLGAKSWPEMVKVARPERSGG